MSGDAGFGVFLFEPSQLRDRSVQQIGDELLKVESRLPSKVCTENTKEKEDSIPKVRTFIFKPLVVVPPFSETAE